MKLGIDLDGVVYDFVGAWQKYWEWRNPQRPIPPWVAWNYWEQDDCDVTFAEWIGNFRDGVLDGQIFWQGVPIEGAEDGLATLHAMGHELIVLTARSVGGAEMDCRWATELWLAQHRIPHDNLIIGAHNFDKNVYGLDVMLDDRVENCEAARDAGEFAICFDRPWNQAWTGARVFSWPEFVETVRGME